MSEAMINLLVTALGDTLLMVFASALFGCLLGLPLGVALHVTKAGQILANPALNKLLGILVNIGRSVPFIARLVEGALMEVPDGLLEAAKAMGAKPLQIITKVLLPEALPGIINSVTITLVTLVNYSAMAGAIGGVAWAMWVFATVISALTPPSCWQPL